MAATATATARTTRTRTRTRAVFVLAKKGERVDTIVPRVVLPLFDIFEDDDEEEEDDDELVLLAKRGLLPRFNDRDGGDGNDYNRYYGGDHHHHRSSSSSDGHLRTKQRRRPPSPLFESVLRDLDDDEEEEDMDAEDEDEDDEGRTTSGGSSSNRRRSLTRRRTRSRNRRGGTTTTTTSSLLPLGPPSSPADEHASNVAVFCLRWVALLLQHQQQQQQQRKVQRRSGDDDDDDKGDNVAPDDDKGGRCDDHLAFLSSLLGAFEDGDGVGCDEDDDEQDEEDVIRRSWAVLDRHQRRRRRRRGTAKTKKEEEEKETELPNARRDEEEGDDDRGESGTNVDVDVDGGVITVISYVSWKRLYRYASERVHVLEEEAADDDEERRRHYHHPLYEYAETRIPKLTAEERRRLVDAVLEATNKKKKQQQLFPAPPLSSSTASALGLMKLFQDRYRDRPRRYGALLPVPSKSSCSSSGGNEFRPSSKYRHSCVPNAQLELRRSDDDDDDDGPTTVAVTALYDIVVDVDDDDWEFENGVVDDGQDDDDGTDRRKRRLQLLEEYVTVNCIVEGGGNDDDHASVEEREEAILRRTNGGRSCGCLRCRYETAAAAAASSDYCENDFVSRLAQTDLLQLGRFYLSNGQPETAKKLYRRLVDDENDDGGDGAKSGDDRVAADARHALGAIELSSGRFLAAQRVWKLAAAKYPGACGADASRRHGGIALQAEKIECYGYFRAPGADAHPSSHESAAIARESKCMFPDVHVAPLLDKSTCKRLISLAKTEGEWTKQRHYAVPTHDVPIHTVPSILDWFNDWMASQVRPLLARQFRTSPNYYVHDAFCVRYQATESSNYLPIHTDESSHSLVLALNDCDDDYDGGGTYFHEYDTVLRLKTGEVASFRGDKLQHGGEAVTRGTRYIIAVFLYHDDDDGGSGDGGGDDSRRVIRKRRLYNGGGDDDNNNNVREVLRESKEQKCDFTFGFSLEEQ